MSWPWRTELDTVTGTLPLRSILFSIIMAGAVGGCREAPAFVAEDRHDRSEPPFRLTYGPEDDRMPAWSADGDSVYYVAEDFENLPSTRGVLVGIPRAGGVARPILPRLQRFSSVPRWFTALSPTPAGERFAYVEVLSLYPDTLCFEAFGASCQPSGANTVPLPSLDLIRIRVRRPGDVGTVRENPSIIVDFEGLSLEVDPNGIVHYTVRNFPFQRQYEATGSPIFRPSWSPGGERLVYSDGLGLLVWSPGGGEAPRRIEGTLDGIWPAWGPAGEWIAFTRLERADSIGAFCSYFGFFGAVQCTAQRTDYVVGRHTLTLVRPDGGEMIELGVGDEPAWGPGGDYLYVRRDGRIWRMSVATGESSPVPGTEGGREPAVSPAGRYLAFSRLMDDGGYDIWVIALEVGS